MYHKWGNIILKCLLHFLVYLAFIKSQCSAMDFSHVLAQVLPTLDTVESSGELEKKNSNAKTPSLVILM